MQSCTAYQQCNHGRPQTRPRPWQSLGCRTVKKALGSGVQKREGRSMAQQPTRGHGVESQVIGEEGAIGAAKTRLHKRSTAPKSKRPAAKNKAKKVSKGGKHES